MSISKEPFMISGRSVIRFSICFFLSAGSVLAQGDDLTIAGQKFSVGRDAEVQISNEASLLR